MQTKTFFTWQNWILAFSTTVIVGILGYGIFLFLDFSKAVHHLGLSKELQFYALDGKTAKIEPLLKQGADINYFDCYTPLEGAMSREHMDIVYILIAHGADVNVKFMDGSALTIATSMHDAGLVKLLLAHGADIRVREYSGKSALDIAKANHDSAIVKLLTNAVKKEKATK